MENKQETGLSIQEKNICDSVLKRVGELEKEGGLQVPQNYSAANALKEAWLILQETLDKDKRPVLQTCTKTSIANALLDMVIQALSPVKKQCYFIAKGGKLYCDKSYFGTIAAAKRMGGVKKVVANVIYENDVFEYQLDLETGEKKIIKHEQKLENIDITKIKGAYAIVFPEKGNPHIEIMTMPQIRSAWNQGPMKGNSPAHKNFADQMAMKTVINRACKLYINTSDDSDAFAEAFNTESYVAKEDTEQEISKEVKESANKKVIDIGPDQMKKVEPKKEPKAKEIASKPQKAEQTKIEEPDW